METEVRPIRIDELDDTPARRARGFELDEEAVGRYAEIELYELVPLRGWNVPGWDKVQISRGGHRMAAARLREAETVLVEVSDGTAEDVEIDALTGNAQHGVRLSDDQLLANAKELVTKHGWGASKVAVTLGIGKGRVEKALRADAVVAEVGELPNLRLGHYHELYTAPPEERARLAKAASERRWSADETRLAVQALKNDRYPREFRERLLAGKEDPYVVTDEGEVGVLRETLARGMAEKEKADLVLPLLEVIHRLEAWRDRWEGDIFGGLQREQLERMSDGVRRAQGILDETCEALKQAASLRTVRS